MRKTNLSESSSLTEWGWQGLRTRHNLADGHARQSLHPYQQDILDDLPSIFMTSAQTPLDEQEIAAANAFFNLAGQGTAMELGVPLFHYSSSVSIDITARALHAVGKNKIGLVTPTFDNIPLLLRRNDLKIIAIPEEHLWSDAAVMKKYLTEIDALFVVIPNNPTGREPDREEFIKLVDLSLSAKCTLICDSSFRFFGNLNSWDQYKILLSNADLDFVVIEDTGKTWPTLELKIGMLHCRGSLTKAINVISDEIILNVSPFVLLVLERFMDVEQVCRLQRRDDRTLCDLVAAAHRTDLWKLLADSPLTRACPSSKVGVEWIRLPATWNSIHLATWLAENRLAIMPGSQFYWDNVQLGHHFMRIALMRDENYFAEGLNLLHDLLAQYRP